MPIEKERPECAKKSSSNKLNYSFWLWMNGNLTIRNWSKLQFQVHKCSKKNNTPIID